MFCVGSNLGYYNYKYGPKVGNKIGVLVGPGILLGSDVIVKRQIFSFLKNENISCSRRLVYAVVESFTGQSGTTEICQLYEVCTIGSTEQLTANFLGGNG